MWVFTAERGIRYTRQKILVGSGPLKGFVDNKKTMEYNRPLTQVDPNFSMTRNTLNTAISCLYCVCVRVQKHVFIVVILIHIQFPYNFPGRSRTHKVSSPHFEQHTSVRISPLLMKQPAADVYLKESDCHDLHELQHAMFLWWCEPVRDQKMQSSCPPYLPTSNTHTQHSNTSSSTLCNSPSPHSAWKDRTAWPPVSHLIPSILPRTVMWTRHTSWLHGGGQKRQTVLKAATAKRKHHRWLINGSLIFKSTFIDYCTVTFTFFSTLTLLTVHRFKQRRWLSHHYLSFIRL